MRFARKPISFIEECDFCRFYECYTWIDKEVLGE
ncbi:hypothetical protein NECAME_10300 [Necator americanus]|uniref:Uncharacterized protein n=1 Tax=Necator americanus TaxID=51031 RepID=W2TC01_NECAM|nr:hypothetical protein NECAME_10300 [Necator americanus]ETN78527.1 hypothetical protein NECAME_10300 [Necator americanus]